MVFEGPTGTFDEADLAGNQSRIVLAALIHERVPMSRDRLAQIVWGDNLGDGWSASLNSLVSRIRSLLNEVGIDGKSTLQSIGGSYSVVLPAGAWVDLEVARKRLDRAEGAMRRDASLEALPDATVASSILRRPFLGGADGEWIEAVRRSMKAALYACYEVLAEGWVTHGDARLAASMAQQAIELDPMREIGYRLLMTAELSRGDTIAALQAFDRCERILRAEFGCPPSPETLAVLQRVGAG
jgi:DNA-binding SARP family transcriptional activator